MKKIIAVLIVFVFAAALYAAGKVKPSETTAVNEPKAVTNSAAAVEKKTEKVKKYKVTFVELGSVKCVPCKMMQPIMKSIEEKYGKDVLVVFYDVWTKEGAPMGEKYGIRGIPTQVFLDENGKEFFRHTGYYPEEEIVKILNSKGVK